MTSTMLHCSVIFSLKDEFPEEIYADLENEQEEEHDIPDEMKCVICLGRRSRSCLFLPCQHCNTCPDCAKIIVESTKKCPVCRQEIDSHMFLMTSA